MNTLHKQSTVCWFISGVTKGRAFSAVMAKTKVHHRRQAPSNLVPTDEHDHRQDDSHHMNTCDRHEMSCKTIVKRVVVIVTLAALVTTVSMVLVVSVRNGPQTILTSLRDIVSFFYGDEAAAAKHTRATTTAHNANVRSDTHLPHGKVSRIKTSNPDEAKQPKLNQKVSAGGAGVKLNNRHYPEVKAKLPAQHQTDTFRETTLRKLKIRDITVDGRSVIGRELVGNKKRPGAANVRVYQFEHFLSDYECDGLVGAHRNHVTQHSDADPIICFDSVETLQRHIKKSHLNIKVTSQDFTEGTSCVNASFSQRLQPILGWSYSTAFYPGETRFTSIFDDRVYRATGLKPAHGGKYQITSYKKGIGYKSHTDCTIGNLDLRDRMGTILVYLQDVEGGQTEFPELGISVTPRKGRAIVWNNHNSDGECDPFSLHVAQPVIKGQKVILQRWYYYKNFYMLGKRPAEPDLPVRKELQPRVSCDEYDHGSCRWYDEWNYDHINQYKNIKSTLL